ncbi:MAG: hypothetical protein AAFW89_06385 [Bacteroidota bacterium]
MAYPAGAPLCAWKGRNCVVYPLRHKHPTLSSCPPAMPTAGGQGGLVRNDGL